MSIMEEFEFLKDFVNKTEFNPHRVTLELEQLRCLWTAFCIHHNFEVDTCNYDTYISKLWDYFRTKENTLEVFMKFDLYMSEFIV